MTSAPTKRTIRPWMMIARLDARSGGKYDGSRFRDAVPVSSAAKSSAARPTPTAVLRPSSATAMPMKPTVEAWICVVSRRNSQPTMSSAPARPAKQPGDRHREEVVAGDADAAVARRLGVVADRPHLVSERRAVERDRVDDERRQREEDADVESLEGRIAPEDWELRLLGDVGGRRDGPGRLGRLRLQRPAEAEEVRADPDDDPVEHDRRDHLVGADRALEQAGDAGDALRRRACPPAIDGDDEQPAGRSTACGSSVATITAAIEPARYWPCAADVEEAAAEGERDGETRQHEGDPEDQRLLEVRGRDATRTRSCSTGTRRARSLNGRPIW